MDGGGALGLGLSPLQFGFRRFRSTADPLLSLEHDISSAFENDKFVLAFSLICRKRMIPRGGNVGFCVNSFLLVFVDIYLSSSDIC